MGSVNESIAAGDTTLVVFSPDAVRSQLVGPIEDAIRAASGAAPVARRWVAHTDDSIEQFYAKSVDTNVPTWHLVSRLFTFGPSLATLWVGPSAGHTILAVKGRSHPVLAGPGTIRSRFWCDNPVTNLIHVSDDPDEVVRELAVLQLADADLLAAPSPLPLAPLLSAVPPTPRHCGILTVCEIVRAGLDVAGVACPPLTPPSDGNAHDTVAGAERWLADALAALPPAPGDAVRQFLDARIRPGELARGLGALVPLTPWDDLLVRAAAGARKGWCAHASG